MKNIYQCKVCLTTFPLLRYLRKHVPVPAVGDPQPNKCQSYYGTTCSLQDNLRDKHKMLTKIVTENLPTDEINFHTEVHGVQTVCTNIFGKSDDSKDGDCMNIQHELACSKFEPDEEDQLYFFNRETQMLPYIDTTNNSHLRSVNNEDRTKENTPDITAIEHEDQEETITQQTISPFRNRVTIKTGDGCLLVVNTPEVNSLAETTCKKCKLACTSLESLCIHYETLHKLPVVSLARITTNQVNVKYKDTKSSNSEIEVEKTKTHECDICNKTFTAFKNLKKHKSSIHDGQIFNCNVCQKPFRWLASLKQHKLSVHEGNRYKCNICSKTYSDLSNLNRHKSSVHNNARFKCDVCQKEFKRFEKLKQHTLNLHEHMKYKCNICPKHFNFYGSLRLHKASIHDGVRHKCDSCPKEYSYTRDLKRHKAVTHDAQRFM